MNNLLRCFVDMDGVLTNFLVSIEGKYNIFGQIEYVPGDWYTISKISKFLRIPEKDIWSDLSTYFWSNMSWMPDGKQILALLEDTFGTENVCILSSPANGISAHGKIDCLKENYLNIIRVVDSVLTATSRSWLIKIKC